MTHHSRTAITLALLAAAPLLGCADIDDADTAEDLVGEAADELSLPPATCQEIKDKHPSLGDGPYTLHLDHDAALPWIAYCHNMAGSPVEYLPLQVTGASSNFSQYTAGSGQGSNVRTQYTRVRIDPVTLNIDIGDQTFATSSGQLQHGSETVTSMPFGVAMSCDASPSGDANIDLTGTSFAVAAGEFATGGFLGSGTSTYSADDQIVDLAGGGYCGWITPTPEVFNPFNNAGDFQLQLEYRYPSTCADIKASVVNAWDGHYTLFLDGDASKPWRAYCHGMGGATPAEYLTLVNVGPGANFSQYTAGGAVSGTNVRTGYTRVRVDPVTLNVDISDQTFATSTGQLIHGGQAVTSMPFGVAMSCNASPSGLGNIDLTGTPFAVAASEFVQGGAGSSGTSTYSSNNRVVNLTGGGFCGWTTPSPGLFNPFNTAGDFQLSLVYTP